MVRVTCYIRPHKLEGVKSAIAALGVSGMNVTDARGTGNSPETSTWFGGEQQLIALPIRARVEVIARDDQQDEIIEAIAENARTGEPGDGKIFVERVTDAIRIRTEERGSEAI
jgi:nitrogen regulatory protein P-II 1